MIEYKERPYSRKALLSLCQKYDCTLEKLLDHPQFCLSHGLKFQARKMISEGKFRSAKELKDFEHRNMLHHAVGLIK